MIYKKKSLAVILGTFTKVRNDLKTLLDQNETTVQSNNAIVTATNNRTIVLNTESADARKVLLNIEKLVGTND